MNELLKYNENHDERGRFSEAQHAFMKEYTEKTWENPIDGRMRLKNTKTGGDPGGDFVGLEVSPRFGTTDEVHISSIQAMEPRKGQGQQGLDWLKELADKHDIKLSGYAKAYGTGRMTTAQLKKWYAKSGFKVDRAGNMERLPVGKLVKFNQYHDDQGRFAESDGAAAGPFHAADEHTHSKTKLGEQYKAVVDQHNSSTSGPEIAALNAYTDGNTRSIESQLRRGEIGPRVQAIVDNLDKVIERSKVPENLTVYRGGFGEKLASLKPGDLVHDKGYVSTTLNANVAAGFAGVGGTGDPSKAIYKINLPKGSSGYFVYDFERENEVLLPRNSVFRVESIATKRYKSFLGSSKLPVREVTLVPVGKS